MLYHPADILDMKPKSMDELTEVITAATFHPSHNSVFLYSSSRGCIKMGDMRASALCDQHAKGQRQLRAFVRSYDSNLPPIPRDGGGVPDILWYDCTVSLAALQHSKCAEVITYNTRVKHRSRAILN